LSSTLRGGLSVIAGFVVAFVFLALDRSHSLATIVGARPLLMATGLGLGAALGSVAAFARHESRTPTLATPVPTLLRILAWWCGVALALALLAFAAWKQWGIVCLFASIATMIKALTVFTYVKRDYEFHVWAPFAVIIGVLVFIEAVFLFLARPNIPPPVEAALQMYAAGPVAQDPASRPAPELPGAGFSLQFEGDVDLGGLPVSFFSYQGGSRVDVYIAKISFPSPLGSTRTADPPGWEGKQANVYLRAGNAPTHFLVVGDSKEAVDAFAHAYFSIPAPSAVLAVPGSTPETANTFTRDRAPLCSDTRSGATPKALARARRASSVAAPFTGADFTLMRTSPSTTSQPGCARGRTRTLTSTPLGPTRTTIWPSASPS
jgi:hypothetical protein